MSLQVARGRKDKIPPTKQLLKIKFKSGDSSQKTWKDRQGVLDCGSTAVAVQFGGKNRVERRKKSTEMGKPGKEKKMIDGSR